jgi:ribose-phosphate pyrophosphokinase
MFIVPGPASIELGERVASLLGLKPKPVDHRIFPDGESYIRLTSNVRDDTVVIVQTTAPDQDRRLIQLIMMTSTAKELGAERVICVVPYLAYSRQDKRFLEGEAFSLDVIVGMLEDAGADDLLVVDAHNEDSLREIQSMHGIKIHNLSAVPILAQGVKDMGYGGAFSLSPDKGGIHLAKAADKILGGGYSFFEKRRDRKTGEIEMLVKDLEIKGKKAVVFDDIISSGGTMARALRGLKDQGTELVAAACTHALFMEGAEKRIEKAGADLIVISDTVTTSVEGICFTVAPLIAEKIREIVA